LQIFSTSITLCGKRWDIPLQTLVPRLQGDSI
jgi:hypothetical protein